MNGDERSLKVRHGPQVFGPMSVTQLAELLAAGRIAETDRVSEGGGPWVTIEEFVNRPHDQFAQAAVQPRASDADDGFVCIRPGTPLLPRRANQPPSRSAGARTEEAPPADASRVAADSDYLLDSVRDELEDDADGPLAESRDPGGPKRRDAESEHEADSYRFARPKDERPRFAAAVPPPLDEPDLPVPPRARGKSRPVESEPDEVDLPVPPRARRRRLAAETTDEPALPPPPSRGRSRPSTPVPSPPPSRRPANPGRSRAPVDDDGMDQVVEETQLDDLLSALAEDEAAAPGVGESPKKKRTGPPADPPAPPGLRPLKRKRK